MAWLLLSIGCVVVWLGCCTDVEVEAGLQRCVDDVEISNRFHQNSPDFCNKHMQCAVEDEEALQCTKTLRERAIRIATTRRTRSVESPTSLRIGWRRH
jgi:hypothetical protein